MVLLWASFGFILVSAAVLAYAMFRYRQILSGTNYFIKAATVYILVGEEDARFAALASGKGAGSKDRDRMKDFLNTLQQSFRNQRGSRSWNAQAERVANIMNELDAGGPMSAEAFEARETLRLNNEVYHRALKTGDAGVFLRRYPQLFRREAERAMSEGQHPDAATEEIVAGSQAVAKAPAAPAPQRAAGAQRSARERPAAS